jgi:hypothetical protein
MTTDLNIANIDELTQEYQSLVNDIALPSGQQKINPDAEKCSPQNNDKTKNINPVYGLSLLDNNPRVNDSAKLYTNPFAEAEFAINDGDPLYKTFLGRVELNVVSRWVMGAAFFTAGAYAVKQWHAGEDTWFTKPLQIIADGIDTVIGTPTTKVLECFVDQAKAKDIMTFNTHVANPAMVEQAMRDGTTKLSEVFGMSLGKAAVDVTFAFAMGSTGAALGRNLALIADPNHKVSWIHEDGIDFVDMAKSTAREGFRILTYNQMEDWFAAIPYLIQRKILAGAMDSNGISNLWELENNHGNTHLVDKEGNIGRSFEVAGLLDLQHRFPLYNFYTLIFRDGYNHIGHSISSTINNGFHFEIPENPIEHVTHCASESVKYLAKSLIKSQIYMQPAMLFFSPMNVAISKENHVLIAQESGHFITSSPTYHFDPKNREDMANPFLQNGKMPAYVGNAVRINDITTDGKYYDGETPINLNKLVNHDPYHHESSQLSGVMNPVGRFVSGYSNGLYNNFVSPTLNLFGINADENPDVKWATSTFARAQTAYFPYMLAKYELAQKWDTPDMDAAIYRGIDGVCSLNVNELGASVADVAKLLTLQQPSEKTHQKSFESRGLLNSTYEVKLQNEITQEKLRWRAAEERHLHEVPEELRPLQKLAGEIAHGDLKDIFENNNVPANNIVSAKGLRIDGKSLNQKSSEAELIKI